MPASEIMKLFKRGDLHSGKSGKVVKDRKQALAILMSYKKAESQK